MTENYLPDLMNEAHDAVLLKRILEKKLNGYGGIRHDELELICAMFGIRKGEEA